MKDKKTVIFLVVAIIIFICALIFAVWSKNAIDNKNSNENEIEQIADTTNTSTQEEVSQTKDLNAVYEDFTTVDDEGKEIKLSDYKDQAVMVLFWNSENEDSIEMLKRVNAMYPKYKDTVKVLAINTKNEKDLEILNEIEVPVYYDQNQEIVNQYNITELPAMLYINAQNEVFNSKTGLTTNDALEANFDILAENF